MSLEGIQSRCLNLLQQQSIQNLGDSDSEEVLSYVQPESVTVEFVTVRSCHPLEGSSEQLFLQILMSTPDKLIGGHQITPEPVLFQAEES